MTSDQIVEKLKNKSVDEIVQSMEKGDFTASELVRACKKKNFSDAEKLSKIALKYDNNGNEKKAFKIYLYAAELGDVDAMGNVALYHFEGLPPCEKDLKIAFKWCDKAVDDGAVYRNVLMAEILIEQKKYEAAMDCLAEVTVQNCNTKESEEARKLEKEIMMSKLRELYPKVNGSAPAGIGGGTQNVALGIGAINLNEKPFDSLNDPQIEALNIDLCDQISKKIDGLKKKKTKAEAKKDTELAADLKEKIEELEKYWAKYANMDEKLIQRQFQTESTFFNPRRTKKKETFQVAEELEERRLSMVELAELEFSQQGLSFLSARQLITAERSTVEASIEITPHGGRRWYQSKIGWKHNPSLDETTVSQSGNTYTSHYSYHETINLFGSELKYRQKVNSHFNHLGDYYMEDLGKYVQIIKVLNGITGSTSQHANTNNEKKLAKLMLNFSCNGAPVTLASLKTIKGDATTDDVNDLNRIFYHCFVKEVARWMLPQDEKHKLPLATAQARALELIIKGHLNFREVFSQNAPYGVFTDEDIGDHPNALRQKVVLINKKYETSLLQILHSYQQFKQANQDGKILSSRKGLRLELQKTFGGESDTDGEGYDSDNETQKLYKKIMDF